MKISVPVQGAVTAGLLLFQTQPALAQSAAQPASSPAGAAEEPVGLSEVVVTALRNTSSLQKVPASVTAVTAEQLVQQRITDVRGVQDLTPSAHFEQQSFNSNLWIRGVGQFDDQDQLDPAVAMYIDDVYVQRPASWSSFFDLDRVEVLTGPQGTLYGRNAVGGAVLMTTKKPGDTFGGQAFIEAGNYNALHVSGAVDLPVSSDLKFRVALDSDHHDGYYSNGLEGRDRYSARVSGLYKPTDDFSALVVAEYDHDDAPLQGGVNDPYIPDPSNPFKTNVDAKTPGYSTMLENWQVHGDFKYNFNGINITYIPAFYHYSATSFAPQVGENVNPTYRGKQISQELRFSGDTGRIHWLGGFYQSHTNAFFHAVLTQGGFGIFNPANVMANYLPPYTLVVNIGPSRTVTDSYAAFGQVTYSLTDQLRLVGGLRYSHDHRRGEVGGIGVSFPQGIPGVSPPFSLPDGAFSGSRNYSHVDYKGGVEYDIASHSMLYANVQSGYIMGGYQNNAQPNPDDDWFKPESLVGLTAGSKNQFFDNRVELNLEGFYYRYRNYQVSAFVPSTGNTVFFNAQKSVLYGVDMDARFQITRSDQLSVNLGLLSAEYKRFVTNDGQNYSGLRMTNAPSVSATLGYQHIWDLGSNGTLLAHVSSHMETSMWGDYTHGAGSKIAGFTRTDANLTYRPDGDRWNVSLWAKNLENTYHAAELSLGGTPGPVTAVFEAPRTYGVRVGVNF